jgi:RNA polymerase sigma-70 factor (ECF subfamily)
MRDWSQDALALVAVESEQVRSKIREGLNQLSDEQRAVFILRDLEGMDTDEVAHVLGISRGLVRQRLHRARLGLRGVLDAFMSGRR